MSLVSELARDPSFIERVKGVVTQALLRNSSETVETEDGPLEGTVTAYRIDDKFILKPVDGSELGWTFEFKGEGEGTIDYVLVDGRDGQATADGTFEGSISVEFADTALGDELASLVADADIKMEDLSATLDVSSPADDPE